MRPSGESELTVSFDLPPGWVRVPANGRPGGLLRRNPYESLARRLVASGAVTKALAPAIASHLERVASADPDVLGIATFVRATSREEHTIVTFAVFLGPRTPEEPLEELAARRGDPRESLHRVESRELPAGPAARAAYSRPRLQGGEARPFVQYWVAPAAYNQLVIALGDIDAPAGAPVEAFVSDIDKLAESLTIKRR